MGHTSDVSETSLVESHSSGSDRTYPPVRRVVGQRRTIAQELLKSVSSTHWSGVRDIVEMAIGSPEPNEVVRQRLKVIQAAQQRKFFSLSKSEQEDEWIQMRHGEQLRLNQTLHDSAHLVLALMSRFSRLKGRP